eukprot:1139074-Pelagomonas_calceolata.AAC.3
MADFTEHLLKDKVLFQCKPAQFLGPKDPFTYLGITVDMIRTAIIPSIAYAFPVAPCSENDLATWDKMTLHVVKYNYKLPLSTGTAIRCGGVLREDKANFGLGCPSVAVECNTRCVAALATSLNNEGKK